MQIEMKKRGYGFAVAVLALCASVGASAASKVMTPELMQRCEILNQLHHVNQKEIRVSKLALDRAQSASVKTFANQMVADHQAADDKVTQLAKSENVDLRRFQPADYEKAAMDDLGKLKGAQFDQAFAMAMKEGHKAAAFFMKNAIAATDDQDLKSLVQSLLPTVEHHETMAANLDGRAHQEAGSTGQNQ